MNNDFKKVQLHHHMYMTCLCVYNLLLWLNTLTVFLSCLAVSQKGMLTLAI